MTNMKKILRILSLFSLIALSNSAYAGEREIRVEMPGKPRVRTGITLLPQIPNPANDLFCLQFSNNPCLDHANLLQQVTLKSAECDAINYQIVINGQFNLIPQYQTCVREYVELAQHSLPILQSLLGQCSDWNSAGCNSISEY